MKQFKYTLFYVGTIGIFSLLMYWTRFTARVFSPDWFIKKVTGKEKLFEHTPLDESTEQILSKAELPVGMLIDKDLSTIRRVFIPLFDAADEFLFQYAQKLVTNTGTRITCMDMKGNLWNEPRIRPWVRDMKNNSPEHIALLNEIKIERKFLQQFDLMLISVESWKKLLAVQTGWLNHTPSNLVLKS